MSSANKRFNKNQAGQPTNDHPVANLEAYPMPLALWDASRRSCLFNAAALKLLGFCQEDFQTQPNLWLQQVYDNDLLGWYTQLRRFNAGTQTVICDYRFFPKNVADPVWLREIMMPIKAHHPLWTSMSAYTDITDLKKAAEQTVPVQEITPQAHDESLRALFHEINNRLQRLSMEIELAGLEAQLPLAATQKFSDSLVNVTRSLALIHDRVVGVKSGR
ncbi:MAG: hypothetical protein FJ145_11325 [Deltaproteobacteria bacterium]|nr:hypothetical protein [Deltaproteobacteria bacterium]